MNLKVNIKFHAESLLTGMVFRDMIIHLQYTIERPAGYMRNDILEYLQNEVYNRCRKPSNSFGIGCYYHIEAVVRNGALLADRYRADKEIVLIAAWLHDIASVTDYSLYEEHHLHGAVIARELLTAMQYDQEKIQIVQNCIRNHRGSIQIEKQSIEEICVADADAISHFDSVPSLLYLTYAERHMNIEDGIQFVREKLERSFEKLSESSKEFYVEKYHRVMDILQ